jgi:predicted DNA-binding transcriptional regulator AlpA
VGQKVDLNDLVDATEIARRLNVKRPQVVHDWRRRHGEFPEPVAFLGNSHVWLWPEVKSWAKSTGRID